MKRWAVAIVLGLVASSLGGCAMQGETCVDWVNFESAADLAESSDLVIIGERVRADGSSSRYGADAAAHVIRVDRVLKGELDESEIRVLSLAPTCQGEGAERYPEGDQLATEGTVKYFLDRSEGSWTTITAYQGAVAVPADGVLPWDPAAPTPAPTPTPTPSATP